MKQRTAVLVLSVLLPACSTMRPVDSPVAYLERNNPEKVLIHAADGELYVLRDPQLRGDTIRGFEYQAQEEIGFSISGIRRLEALQPNKARTTAFIGAMTLLGSAGIYMIANASNGKKLICDNYDVQNRCITQPTGSARISIPLPLRF